MVRESPTGMGVARSVPRPSPARTLGVYFRALRESQNLSQEQLAALTRSHPGRVSRAMISAVECGKHLPGLDVLLTLSQALHVSPVEILERFELCRGEPVDVAGLTPEEIDERAGKAFWAGEHRRAAAHYDALRRLLEERVFPDPRERARSLATVEIRRGTALRRCGAMSAARGAVERAIALSEGLPELQAQGYVVLAATLVQLGCLPLARDAAERAVAIAQEAPPAVRGWAWIEKGEVLAAYGRHDEARRAFLEARKHVREAGDLRHEVHVEGNIGACLRGMGRPEQARRRYEQAVRLARRHAIPASEALWTLELARLAHGLGQFEEADAQARCALRLAKAIDHRLTIFRAEWLRHVIHRRVDPLDSDRHRVAYLKRLYSRLEDHRGIDEVREFREAYGSTAPERGPA